MEDINVKELIENMSHLKLETRRKANGLSRKFGKFKCHKCKKEWHSAVVWCSEAGDPKYDQKCKKCKTGVLPFEVSDLVCSKCGNAAKDCECKKEKIVYDENKPHIASLCGRCKYLGHPCYQRNYQLSFRRHF